MIESIERIERIKGINYDVGQREDKESTDKDASGKKFSDFLKNATNKAKNKAGKSAEKPSVPGEAYKLDMKRASQSFFYNGAIDFRAVRRNLSEYI